MVTKENVLELIRELEEAKKTNPANAKGYDEQIEAIRIRRADLLKS